MQWLLVIVNSHARFMGEHWKVIAAQLAMHEPQTIKRIAQHPRWNVLGGNKWSKKLRTEVLEQAIDRL